MNIHQTYSYSKNSHSNPMCRLVLVIWPYTKAANAVASVQAFPWIGLTSTTSFILIMHSFTCRPNQTQGRVSGYLANQINHTTLFIIFIRTFMHLYSFNYIYNKLTLLHVSVYIEDLCFVINTIIICHQILKKIP